MKQSVSTMGQTSKKNSVRKISSKRSAEQTLNNGMNDYPISPEAYMALKRYLLK